ncbi:serine protease [Phytomonospora sp. NPDC050363]|uniref:trypsin-like serine peptidase n=1 Tax=Phytomonospora sp. NPDC050363 TaxID=3155642 RepID=UPI0033FC452F
MRLAHLPRILAASVLGAAALAALSGGTGFAEPSAPVAAPPAAPQIERVGAEETAAISVDYSVSSEVTSQTVRHPGATYVKVHFGALSLAAGDYVTVSDPSGAETHTYHGAPGRGLRSGDSGYTLHGDSGFAAMSIEGDTAIVTVHRESDKGLRGLGASAPVVTIDKFWRGYDEAEYNAVNIGLMSVCGSDARRDVVCYQTSHPTQFARSRPVARLLIGGTSACTGFRVGDTNRLLTNNHCTATQAGVVSTETQFNYQCQTCGGNNPYTPTKVSGATLVKTSASLDYTLYSVNNFSTISSFGTLYIESRQPVSHETIYIPGHGDATAKRLSIYETAGGALCDIDTVNLDSVNTGYLCDTSGGNSGSPVLATSTHRVIALHHLGGCQNAGTRMSLIHPQIIGLIDNTP